MARAKGGFKTRQRRKRVLKQAKGFYGRRKNCFRSATEAVDHALKYAYRDRRVKKRDFRALWITRINCALQPHNYSYSRFIKDLSDNNIVLDRKILAYLALEEPTVFNNIVTTVQPAA